MSRRIVGKLRRRESIGAARGSGQSSHLCPRLLFFFSDLLR